MTRTRKDSQLQIRLTTGQKRRIEDQARRSGKTVSALVLGAVLGAGDREFQRLVSELARAGRETERLALAAIHDLLDQTDARIFESAFATPELTLDPRRANILAAMVEYAARRKRLPTPTWTAGIAPLECPVFGSELQSLRAYLLVRSPVEFRRRNLFVDASVGERV